jgi:hypothetical protein
MTERRRGAKRATTAEPARALVLYGDVVEEADRATFAAAPAAPGLAEEVALVRMLLRQHLREHPGELEMTIKGLHLLVRMVTAQHKLSGADAAELSDRLSELADEMAIAILGKEPIDG